MIRACFASLMLLSAAPAAAEEPEQTIVVTGTPLSETAERLRACLARKCPPKEDIDATLAHAENLFVAGDYAEARRIARNAIGRNAKHRKTLPVDVSDLYRAHARVSAHLGEGRSFEQSTFAMRRALRSGLPEDDPRQLGADLEVAAMYAAMGKLDRARDVYKDVAEDAEKRGRADLAAIARVRAAWVHRLAGDTHLARAELRRIADDGRAESGTARLTAMVLLARLDRSEGKHAASAALIERLRGTGGASPVLLFAPAIDDGSRAMSEGGSATRRMQVRNVEDRWIDVGFWITPEGRVSDLEVLRSGGPLDWTKPLLRSIEGRVYAPPADASYRVERYTYTAHWGSRTGSWLRAREPQTRIEFLDLTAEAGGGRP